jgi:hypothetical protein
VLVPRDLARAVRLGLKVEQLRVNAVAFDETVKRIAPASAALVTLDAQHVGLPAISLNVIAPSRGITTAHQPATRAPSVLPSRYRFVPGLRRLQQQFGGNETSLIRRFGAFLTTEQQFTQAKQRELPRRSLLRAAIQQANRAGVRQGEPKVRQSEIGRRCIRHPEMRHPQLADIASRAHLEWLDHLEIRHPDIGHSHLSAS